MTNVVAVVIAILSLSPLISPTTAFVSTSSTTRAVIGRPHTIHHPQSTRLFEQPSTQSSTPETDTLAPSIMYNITTFVGKSASSLVSVSFFLLLAYHRDALLVTLFIGSIINSVWGKILKKLLNHDRPAELQLNENVKIKPSDGGMPSSHAMSLGFIGTAILVGVVPGQNQLIVGATMATYSAMALRYRVRDHLHTVEQVAVGLFLGVLNAVAWIKYGVGGDYSGPAITWVKDHCVSAHSGLLPYPALVVPVIVGIFVVGSFERRIARWLKNKTN
ncbi:hypothetical protein ACHAXS_002358 [Conticribra weissflogii]